MKLYFAKADSLAAFDIFEANKNINARLIMTTSSHHAAIGGKMGILEHEKMTASLQKISD